MKGIWVVEMLMDAWRRPVLYEPTMGVGLTKADGKKELALWKGKNPSDRFRMVRYISTRDSR